MNLIDNLIALDFIGKLRRWAPRDRFAMIEDPREHGGARKLQLPDVAAVIRVGARTEQEHVFRHAPTV